MYTKSKAIIIKSYLPIENCINDLVTNLQKIRSSSAIIIKSFSYLSIENFTNNLLSDDSQLRTTIVYTEKVSKAIIIKFFSYYLPIENCTNDLLRLIHRLRTAMHRYTRKARASKAIIIKSPSLLRFLLHVILHFLPFFFPLCSIPCLSL